MQVMQKMIAVGLPVAQLTPEGSESPLDDSMIRVVIPPGPLMEVGALQIRGHIDDFQLQQMDRHERSAMIHDQTDRLVQSLREGLDRDGGKCDGCQHALVDMRQEKNMAQMSLELMGRIYCASKVGCDNLTPHEEHTFVEQHKAKKKQILGEKKPEILTPLIQPHKEPEPEPVQPPKPHYGNW